MQLGDRIPGAFADRRSVDPEEPYSPFPERAPVLIWDPTALRIQHPLDGITWSGEPQVSDHPEDQRIEAYLYEQGTDLLAWYRSFHVDSDAWGIYIREWGLTYLTRRLGGRRALALRALWAHEYFHFLTDVAATSLEASSGRPVYLPYLAKYHRPWGWCLLDEGLANAFSLHDIGRRAGKTLLRDFMKRQPDGYRDFARYERRARDDRLTRGYRQLAGHLSNPPLPCRVDGSEAPLGELLVDETGRAVSPWDVPIYFVPLVRQELLPRYFVTLLPEIHETARFRKELAKLASHSQRRWTDVKADLARSTRATGVNFGEARAISQQIFSANRPLYPSDSRTERWTVDRHWHCAPRQSVSGRREIAHLGVGIWRT